MKIMQLNWYGQSCFKITTSFGKNGLISIVIDPFSEQIGLKLPKLEADILLISHDHSGHNNIKFILNNPFLITNPGEYEIKGVFIQGIQSFHDNSDGKERGGNTIYVIEAEEMRICHLGDLGQKELTDEQLEKIGEVDILIIPTGGISTISGKEASKIISQIESKIIIPMHYYLPKLRKQLEKVDDFLKNLGIKKIEPLNKLSIKKKDIVTDETKFVILNP